MDSRMQEIIDEYEKLGSLPIEDLNPVNARNQPELRDAVVGVLQEHITQRALGVIEPVAKIHHIIIPTSEGDLEARVYTPVLNEILPCILYFHGGGFVLANLNSYDASCRAIANATKAIVVSVAYRQAPEHPFPAAHHDAINSYIWLLANAASLNADEDRIAVCGECTGGNLAAHVSLKARDLRIPKPIHQVLIYPMVDNNFNTISYRRNGHAEVLNKKMMSWFLGHYAPKDNSESYAFPLKARLEGSPNTTVITAEIDPLCSEGALFARKLKESGVEVSYMKYNDVCHNFLTLVSVLPIARTAINFIAFELLKPFTLSVEEDE